MLTTRPRGTNDIIAAEATKWQYVENIFREVCHLYGYQEIRTPVFEHTDLFLRGVGETTDIVSKEMYTFTDRGDRSLTLRPENTASAVRAFLENKLYANQQPTKLYYIGPMFRYDRPQAGRFRQFHQAGIEVFGSSDPQIDVEVLAMAMDFYNRLGLNDLELHINSIGCPECRPAYREKLKEYFLPHLADLCPDCRQRYEKNPLRILDCKVKECKAISAGAPTPLTCLCDDCRNAFDSVQQGLSVLGVDFIVDETLVRGLDYYTNTAFEIVAKGIGAQSSIGGGGRYDGLVEEIGGASTPGIGYALGLERIILTMEQQGIEFRTEPAFDVFVAVQDNSLSETAMKLLADLRRQGISAEKDYMSRSLKAQMRYADKKGAGIIVVIAPQELSEGCCVLKDMKDGSQEVVSLDDVGQTIASKFQAG